MSTNGDIDPGVLLTDLLDLDLSELDDAEYDIPPVEKTPTLESILNDDESSLISEEELSNYLPQELLSANLDDTFETGSVSSVGSRGGHSPAYRKQAPTESILRHVVLKSFSSHLQSLLEGEDGGQASVVCWGEGSVIGVGTSRGVVGYLSGRGVLWTLARRDQGPVTCVAINPQATRLLAGFSRGLALMVDTSSGKVIRSIDPESHAPSTAVVHLKFTDVPSVALLSDSGGSVFELSLRRVLGVRSWESRCVFSGSRGEVVALEPLLHTLPSHPLAGSVIVAMATLSKLLLIELRPETRLLFTYPTAGSPASLPLLSWQFVVIQVADSSRVMDPVLAYARHDVLHFFQVSVEASGRVGVHPLQSVSLDYSAIACHWLGSRAVAVVDSKETLHLVDVRARTQLEELDLAPVQLVYTSAAFKAIATGGNVSRAMAVAGERSCYNTIQGVGGQLLLLGTKGIHTISIRIWTERINNLVHQNRFGDALRLAMEFYEERGKAMLGLRGPKLQRQKIVRHKVEETLLKLIDKVLEGSEDINYHESIPIIVDYCLLLDLRELLFEKVWTGLGGGPWRVQILEAVEAAILEGRLRDPPPELMQAIVSHLVNNNRLKEVEEAVQRVEVTCLDLEQVVVACKAHALYPALVSVWNRAMADYTSPLFELVPVLSNYMTQGKVKESRELGNLLLVYVATCLGGDTESRRAEQARQHVLRALCTQHSTGADDSEHCFPYLRTLLKFDTREFLNALSIAFADCALTLQMRQRLVDILVQLMADHSAFTSVEAGWVASAVCGGGAGRGVRVDAALAETALERLTSEEDCSIDDRQAALLALHNARVLPPQSILAASTAAQLDEVVSVVLEEMGDVSGVIGCQLRMPGRRSHVFSYIEQLPSKETLAPAILDNIEGLVGEDATRAGALVVRHWPQLVAQVIPLLSDAHLYAFLEGMLGESGLDTEHMTRYVCLMCQLEPEKAAAVTRAHTNIEIDTTLMVSQELGLDDVSAILLERSGRLQEAFDLLLNRLHNSINQGEEVDSQLEELVRLAQRGDQAMDSTNSWLPLLTCLLTLNSHELLQRVLSNAELNLVSELHLLMQHTHGTLAELRPLIMGLFGKCRTERGMVGARTRVLCAELHSKLASELRQARRGALVSRCPVCTTPSSPPLILFRCGHGFHTDCLESSTVCQVCSQLPTK